LGFTVLFSGYLPEEMSNDLDRHFSHVCPPGYPDGVVCESSGGKGAGDGTPGGHPLIIRFSIYVPFQIPKWSGQDLGPASRQGTLILVILSVQVICTGSCAAFPIKGFVCTSLVDFLDYT